MMSVVIAVLGTAALFALSAFLSLHGDEHAGASCSIGGCSVCHVGDCALAGVDPDALAAAAAVADAEARDDED